MISMGGGGWSDSQPHVLAVDLGVSGVKVALVAFDGTHVGWEVVPVEMRQDATGAAEQDPEEWWQALQTAVARLHRSQPETVATIVAVCCSAQGDGTIAVDSAGRPLTACLTWLDGRGAKYLKKQYGGPVSLRGGMSVPRLARWVRITGGAPSPAGTDQASHMLRVREELPDVYERTYKFLAPLDFINLRLTGRFVGTWDSALTSWMTDNRNPHAVRYHERLVADSGIDRDKLPELVPSTQVLGPLSSEAAELLGLPTSVQVVAGAVDNSAAAIGAGTIDDGDLHLYIGTSSWLAAHVPYKKTDILGSVASVPCAIPGRYLLTALQTCGGVNLVRLRDNITLGLLPGGALSVSSADPIGQLEILEGVAAQSPPGANGVIYTPWLAGERAPVDDPSLRGTIFNLSMTTRLEDVVRAFYEGVALNTRWTAGSVNRFLGSRMTEVTMVGGGAQSDLWCQIFADVLGVRVRQLKDPVAANARGAAWIAGVGMRELEFADVPSRIAIRQVYEPDPQRHATYDERFETFEALHHQLSPIFHRLHGTPGS